MIALFSNQQHFVCLVFAKTPLKGKAADFLQECSDPAKPTFSGAQVICADLVNHFKDGANARMGAHDIEKKLLTMHLNCEHTKTVTAFVNQVATLAHDCEDALNNIHDEECHIEKLDAAFQEHKDMLAHIQALETQGSMLAWQFGGGMPLHACNGQLHELTQHAIILDKCCHKNQSTQ